MKLAICLGAPADEATAVVRRMVAAQAWSPAAPRDVIAFPLGAVGFVGRPGQGAGDLLRRQAPNGNVLVVAGTPIARGRSLDADLARAVEEADATAVALLEALDGAYVAVLWQEREQRLSLVTDCLGMQPLYTATRGRRVLYASELKGIAAAEPAAAPVPDPAAWGAVFYFGHPISARTTVTGVRRVEPATVITHAPGDAELRERRYWRWEATGGVPAPAAADAIVAELRLDAAAYAAQHAQTTLLLSGGFDSRLNLALAHEVGLSPRLLSHSHPDENADADGKFAHATARIFGATVERARASADFFSSDGYLDYLRRNELITPSLYLFIANVSHVVTPAMRAVWDGCILGPALKFGRRGQGFDAYLREALAGRRARHEAAGALLFRRDWLATLNEGFDAELRAERERLGDGPIAPWRFNLETRVRYRTGTNPYQVYDSVVAPLTPALSKASWEQVCLADHAARVDLRLYMALYSRHFPAALRVPVVSGHEMINTGGRATPRFYRQRAAAAAADLLRRPKVARALGRLGAPPKFTWHPSRFVEQALAEAPLESTVFDDAALGRLRRRDRPPTPPEALAIEMLFYMQAWRRVLDGTLEAWRSTPAVSAPSARAVPAAERAS